MPLNKNDIIGRGIIIEPTDRQFRDASYDLAIEDIIDMDGQNQEGYYKLKPQGMVYVIFREILELKRDVIGFAHVKTSLTKKGIMATNIGIIDPGYKGLISTLLINFGNTEFSVQKGDLGLRVTFEEIQELSKEEQSPVKNISNDEYKKEIRGNTDLLDKKFLNLSNVEKDVKESVIGSLIRLGVVFTIGAFLIAAYFQFKNSKERDLDKAIKNYEYKVDNLQQQILKLENKLSRFQDSTGR